METCLGIEIEMKPYLIKRLKTLAINKSEKTGRNVTWQDIFNKVYNHAIKNHVDDVIENQLIENLDFIAEKSEYNSCDVVYYIERNVMKLIFELDLSKAALIMSSSEDKKLKEEYSGCDLNNIAVRVWNSNDEFRSKLEKYALELFVETISESVNEELMRDKNCWE